MTDTMSINEFADCVGRDYDIRLRCAFLNEFKSHELTEQRKFSDLMDVLDRLLRQGCPDEKPATPSIGHPTNSPGKLRCGLIFRD